MVCLGNTARSPVAEYLARYYAQKNELSLTIQSAGFFNAFSYMQPESKEYLQSKGIDNTDFKPQLITPSLLEQQDLILTMENSHMQDILKNFKGIKNLKEKIFTLKEFNGENDDLDIIDPYYTSHSTYIKVLKIIDENVEAVIKKLKIINQETSS